MNLIAVITAPVRGVFRTVTALPRVVDAVLVLPTLLEELERVNRNTDALPEMLAELRAVGGDTTSLPGVHEELSKMRREIAAMRETVKHVEENTLAVERLAEIAVPLQGAALRVGRLADRLPQRRAGYGGRDRPGPPAGADGAGPDELPR